MIIYDKNLLQYLRCTNWPKIFKSKQSHLRRSNEKFNTVWTPFLDPALKDMAKTWPQNIMLLIIYLVDSEKQSILPFLLSSVTEGF